MTLLEAVLDLTLIFAIGACLAAIFRRVIDPLLDVLLGEPESYCCEGCGRRAVREVPLGVADDGTLIVEWLCSRHARRAAA